MQPHVGSGSSLAPARVVMALSAIMMEEAICLSCIAYLTLVAPISGGALAAGAAPRFKVSSSRSSALARQLPESVAGPVKVGDLGIQRGDALPRKFAGTDASRA